MQCTQNSDKRIISTQMPAVTNSQDLRPGSQVDQLASVGGENQSSVCLGAGK